MPVISVEGLTFTRQQVLFSDISFTVEPGLTALIGPNGSGKTTLLRLLLGFEKYEGRIDIQGSVGYVPQHLHVDMFPGTVEELLGDFEPPFSLASCKDRQYKTLSGGQKQRVLIALALTTNPDVLLLDEPTSGVDIHGQNELYDLLNTVKKEGVTIVIATHDIGFIPTYADDVLCLHADGIHHAQPDTALQDIKELYPGPIHVHH